MTGERTYSDQEVALILQRAMEMQQEPARRSDGLSLAQLRDIASQIGVEPDLVTAAAGELPVMGQGTSGGLLGGPLQQEFRLVHPVALTRDQLQTLVMAIRSAMRHQGRTRDVLGALEWTTFGELSEVAVTARVQEGRTIVHVMTNRSGAAIVTVVGSVSLGAFSAAIIGSILEPGLPGGVAIMAAGLLGGAATARAIWRATSRRFQQKLTRLAEAVRRSFEG